MKKYLLMLLVLLLSTSPLQAAVYSRNTLKEAQTLSWHDYESGILPSLKQKLPISDSMTEVNLAYQTYDANGFLGFFASISENYELGYWRNDRIYLDWDARGGIINYSEDKYRQYRDGDSFVSLIVPLHDYTEQDKELIALAGCLFPDIADHLADYLIDNPLGRSLFSSNKNNRSLLLPRLVDGIPCLSNGVFISVFDDNWYKRIDIYKIWNDEAIFLKPEVVLTPEQLLPLYCQQTPLKLQKTGFINYPNLERNISIVNASLKASLPAQEQYVYSSILDYPNIIFNAETGLIMPPAENYYVWPPSLLTHGSLTEVDLDKQLLEIQAVTSLITETEAQEILWEQNDLVLGYYIDELSDETSLVYVIPNLSWTLVDAEQGRILFCQNGGFALEESYLAKFGDSTQQLKVASSYDNGWLYLQNDIDLQQKVTLQDFTDMMAPIFIGILYDVQDQDFYHHVETKLPYPISWDDTLRSDMALILLLNLTGYGEIAQAPAIFDDNSQLPEGFQGYYNISKALNMIDDSFIWNDEISYGQAATLIANYLHRP